MVKAIFPEFADRGLARVSLGLLLRDVAEWMRRRFLVAFNIGEQVTSGFAPSRPS